VISGFRYQHNTPAIDWEARAGKWKDDMLGERVSIASRLAAKSLLAWLVLFGAMQPS
jgi:hypothetical protein